jgi:putative transposase
MDRSVKGGSRSSPVHYYIDHAAYFITAATYHHQPLLDDNLKGYLHQLIQATFEEHGWQLEHWVILDDHYHLLAQSQHGRDLPRIIGKIHNLSAQWINQRYPAERREYKKVWHNYWDYCPRDEREYLTRLCYLLTNPIKHGYVERLSDWEWSNFHLLMAAQGEEELRKTFQRHREYHNLSLREDP